MRSTWSIPTPIAPAFPDADRLLGAERRRLAERPASQRGRLFAVVATLGQHDEEATLAALGLEPAYLGVVASRKRFAQIRETLVARGVVARGARLDREPGGHRHRRPRAGGSGAQHPGGDRQGAAGSCRSSRAVASTPAPPAREERDPVCGMTVAVEGARHRAEHAGRTYYFCCGGCRERFLAAPDRYAAAAVS